MQKKARMKASSSLGLLISLGEYIISVEVQKLFQRILKVVSEELSSLHFRAQKCYTLILMAAYLVGLVGVLI